MHEASAPQAAGFEHVAPLQRWLTPHEVSAAQVLLVQVAPMQAGLPLVPQLESMLQVPLQWPATHLAPPPQLASLLQLPSRLHVPCTDPLRPVPQAPLSQSAFL